MGALRQKAQSGQPIFAPIIFRLAMRLEQSEWSDIEESPSETVFVLRSAERLFKLDVICAAFDSWLEAEAAGAKLERDELGRVTSCGRRATDPPSVAEVMKSAPIERTVEILRRLSGDGAQGALPVVSLTMGATLFDRLSKSDDGAGRLLSGLRNGGLVKSDADLLGFTRELTISLAKSYLEAGAAGLLLLQDVDNPDLIDLSEFEALFNLATYYDVPMIVLSSTPLSSTGRAALDRIGTGLFAAPGETGSSIVPLGDVDENQISVPPSAWLAATPWEADPTMHPDTVHNWRRQVIGG